MDTLPHDSTDTARAIGELCIAGDWACTRGDLPALEAIAYQLSAYLREPVHCELSNLGELCNSDLERAIEIWNRLKDHVYHSAS